MKTKKIPVALKTFLLFLTCVAVFGFSTGKKMQSEGGLTETQFHDNIAGIISGKGISQTDLARTMLEAERRKSERETASGYIENYMNTHFKAASSTNRVSIASPGQSDLNMSAACDQTALQTLISNAIGYYYVFAIKCNGVYKYDGANYTGGSTVYVRAEASNYIHEAFILF